MLKENADIFSAYICDFLNKTIRSCKFPAILKNGDITAAFKKRFKRSKEKLLTSNILPIISKMFEKIISKNLQTLWTYYCQNANVGFEEVLVHKIVFWQC